MFQRVLRLYARGQAAAVDPCVRGHRILDLGAGEGYTARALGRRLAVWVCSVDVGLFCRAPGPYVVYDGARLPFGDEVFDTTLLLLTLHHCADPRAVLDEAVRVTRSRLIVIESVYRTRLERFWLALLDGRLNRLRHGGAMPVPGQFRTPAEWQTLFASRRLDLVATRWLGFAGERLVHHPLMYVLDKPGAAGAA